MKRAVVLSLCLIFLTGCGGIYANFRELEQLRIVQTMGIDYIPGGTELSLSSANAADEEKNALCLSGSGSTISEALSNIRAGSSQEDLFLSQVKQLLIGEKAAKMGMEPYFAYICRSPDLRIDIPVFIVKGRTAKETMSGAGSGNKGISEIFEALQSSENRRHSGRIVNASQLINNLHKYGGALLAMLEYIPGSENTDDTAMTSSLSGYAIINGDTLQGYIDSENALGADLLLNRSGISDIVIEDSRGFPVSMELSTGSSRIEPVWDGSELKGINVFIKLRATVLELQDAEQYTAQELSDSLLSGLESYVSDKAAYVLQLSRKLQCDFLGLAASVSLSEPYKYAELTESFTELLPQLQMQISVSAELCHTKDVKEGES